MARRGVLGTAGLAVLAVGVLLFGILRPWSPDRPSENPTPVVTLPGASPDNIRAAAEAAARSAQRQTPPPVTEPDAAKEYLHGDGAPLVEAMHAAALSHLAARRTDEQSCATTADTLGKRMQPARADQLAAGIPDAPLAEAFIAERRALATALGSCEAIPLESLWLAVGTVEIRLHEIGYWS